MVAVLMCGELFLGMRQMSKALPSIRWHIQTAIETTAMAATYTSTSSTWGQDFIRQELVFRLVRQIDYDKYLYQYEGENFNPKFAFNMYDRVEELQEPDENVNMNKLKHRIKNRLYLKDLLKRYLAS